METGDTTVSQTESVNHCDVIQSQDQGHVTTQDGKSTECSEDLIEGGEELNSKAMEQSEKNGDADKSNEKCTSETEQKENTSDNKPNSETRSDNGSQGGAIENNGTGGSTRDNKTDSDLPKLDNDTETASSLKDMNESVSERSDLSEMDTLTSPTSDISEFPSPLEEDSKLTMDTSPTMDNNNCGSMDNSAKANADNNVGVHETTDNDKSALSVMDSNDNIKDLSQTTSDVDNVQVGDHRNKNAGVEQTGEMESKEKEIVSSANMEPQSNALESPQSISDDSSVCDDTNEGLKSEECEDFKPGDHTNMELDSPCDESDADVSQSDVVGDAKEDVVKKGKNSAAENATTDCDMNANANVENDAKVSDGDKDTSNDNSHENDNDEAQTTTESEELKSEVDGTAATNKDVVENNPSKNAEDAECDVAKTESSNGLYTVESDVSSEKAEASEKSEINDNTADNTSAAIIEGQVATSGSSDTSDCDKKPKTSEVEGESAPTTSETSESDPSQRTDAVDADIESDFESESDGEDFTYNDSDIENELQIIMSPKRKSSKAAELSEILQTLEGVSNAIKLQAIPQDDDVFLCDTPDEHDGEGSNHSETESVKADKNVTGGDKDKSDAEINDKSKEQSEIDEKSEEESSSAKNDKESEIDSIESFERKEGPEDDLKEVKGDEKGEDESGQRKEPAQAKEADQVEVAEDNELKNDVVAKMSPSTDVEEPANETEKSKDSNECQTSEEKPHYSEISDQPSAVEKSEKTKEEMKTITPEEDENKKDSPSEKTDKLEENVEVAAVVINVTEVSSTENLAKDTEDSIEQRVNEKDTEVVESKDSQTHSDETDESDSKVDEIQSEVSDKKLNEPKKESDLSESASPEVEETESKSADQAMTESNETVSRASEPESKNDSKELNAEKCAPVIESKKESKEGAKETESFKESKTESEKDLKESKGSDSKTIGAKQTESSVSESEKTESLTKSESVKVFVEEPESKQMDVNRTESPSKLDSVKIVVEEPESKRTDISKTESKDVKKKDIDSVKVESKSESTVTVSKKSKSKDSKSSKSTESKESKDELKPLGAMQPPKTPPTKHRFGSFTGKAAAKIERYQSKRGQRSPKPEPKNATKVDKVPSSLPEISISDLDTGVTKMVPRSKDDTDGSLLAGVVMRRKPQQQRQEQLEKRSDQYLQQKIDHEIRMRDGTAKLLAASKHPQQMLEAAKNLLTSNSRMIAYMSELQRRKTHEVLQRNRAADGNQTPCQGKVAVSELRIPLMWKDSDHFRNKGDHRRYAVFCLWKIGTEIYDTTIIKDVDRAMTDLSFEDIIVFNDIKPDFECRLEVYCHKLCEDLTMASTHRRIKKKFNEISTSVGRSVGKRLSGVKDESDFMSNMLVGPKFEMIANATLKLADITNSTATYDLITDSSQVSTDGGASELPLFGHFCCRLAAQPHCMVKETTSGLLRVKNGASWEQYWCQLKEMTLCCYDSPTGPDTTKKSSLRIKIQKNTQVLRGSPGSSSGQNFCFQLSSSSKFSKTQIFAADSEAELEKWWQALQQSLLDLALWQHACDENVELPELPSHRQSSYISRQSQRGSLYEETPLKDDVPDSPMSRILARLNVSEEDDPEKTESGNNSKKSEKKIETDV